MFSILGCIVLNTSSVVIIHNICVHNDEPSGIILVRNIILIHRLYNCTDNVASANNGQKRWGYKPTSSKHGSSYSDVNVIAYDADNNARLDDLSGDGYGKQNMLNPGKCMLDSKASY